ncbi:hypothetical protein WMY93_005899 [Mugilogobius chulae]|uniref:Uncharacterized protein n=1 Tax=Mugilogobius chulae TaxID=88201 RepID=A0AAW0PLB8_9GOBI
MANVELEDSCVLLKEREREIEQRTACAACASDPTRNIRHPKALSLCSPLALLTLFVVNRVKVKLASFRTQYGKLILPKASGSGHKPLSSKQQWIVRHLDFLKTHKTHRSPRTTLRTDTVPYLDTTDEDQMEELSTIDPEQLADICPTSSLDTVETGSSIRPNVKKWRTLENIETTKLELLKQVQSTLSASANANSEDIFGQQVAAEHRDLHHLILPRHSTSWWLKVLAKNVTLDFGVNRGFLTFPDDTDGSTAPSLLHDPSIGLCCASS